MPQVSVSVSLAPDGSLQLELPASAGASRLIPLRQTTLVDPTQTIRRVLLGLAANAAAIGEDGAPTRQQVAHWERHGTWPDARCPFCQEEMARQVVGRGRGHRSSHAFDARYADRELGGGVVVRRVPQGQTGKQARAEARRAEPINTVTNKSLKELGF